LDKATSKRIVREIKKMEDRGYQFDAAEGSLSLLIKKQTGAFIEPFTLESYHVLMPKGGMKRRWPRLPLKSPWVMSRSDRAEATAHQPLIMR